MRISDWSSDVCSSDLSAYGRLDIIYNNAGITLTPKAGARRTSLLDATPDDIARVTGVNINGVLYGSKAEVRQFNAQNGGGVIVNRSAEHTSEIQSLMRISYGVFCSLKNIDINKDLPSTELGKSQM